MIKNRMLMVTEKWRVYMSRCVFMQCCLGLWESMTIKLSEALRYEPPPALFIRSHCRSIQASAIDFLNGGVKLDVSYPLFLLCFYSCSAGFQYADLCGNMREIQRDCWMEIGGGWTVFLYSSAQNGGWSEDVLSDLSVISYVQRVHQ